MQTDYLPEEAQQLIAQKLGSLLPLVFGPEEKKMQLTSENTTLEESISVWFLPASSLTEQDDTTLEKLARPSDRWHHQIEVSGRPLFFARSKGSTVQESELEEVFESELPEKIRAALEQISTTHKPDSLVRLVTAPAYLTDAVWVKDEEDQVIVVNAPSLYEDLPIGREFKASEFISILRKQQPVAGITN